MRTTLTLDPDVAQMLEEEVHRQRRPLKHVVNEAIRRGLSRAPEAAPPPYRVAAHRTTLRSGIDPSGLNKLADEMEDDEVVRRTVSKR